MQDNRDFATILRMAGFDESLTFLLDFIEDYLNRANLLLDASEDTNIALLSLDAHRFQITQLPII